MQKKDGVSAEMMGFSGWFWTLSILGLVVVLNVGSVTIAMVNDAHGKDVTETFEVLVHPDVGRLMIPRENSTIDEEIHNAAQYHFDRAPLLTNQLKFIMSCSGVPEFFHEEGPIRFLQGFNEPMFAATMRPFQDDRKHTFEAKLNDLRHRTFLMILFSLWFIVVFSSVGFYRLFRESSAKLTAQEKLARQQSHEQRNRLAPVMVMMETILEATTLTEVDRLKPEVRTSLVSLQEIESLHQTRCDCYKIMRNSYNVKMEIFDLIAFLQTKLDCEEAIAKALAGRSSVSSSFGVDTFCHDDQGDDDTKANAHPELNFKVEIYDDDDQTSTTPRTTTSIPEGLHIKCDAYILNHVVTNLLSNARKYTSRGSIVLSFHGETNGTLVFRVTDTGRGIPEGIRDRLFRTEVTTGDNRGTGLGLPSCGLFCKAAGGYARLVDTCLQDAEGNGGFTIIQFAVQGNVIQVEEDQTPGKCLVTPTSLRPSSVALDDDNNTEPSSEDDIKDDDSTAMTTTLPRDVHVVVIDDSDINRRCLIMRLEKVVKASGARNWRFTQFPTFEGAQTYLASIDHAKCIVTLDENMQTKGGLMTGRDGVRWLVARGFPGLIISASGEVGMSDQHLALGAHLAWSKPCPSTAKIQRDLETYFSSIYLL